MIIQAHCNTIFYALQFCSLSRYSKVCLVINIERLMFLGLFVRLNMSCGLIFLQVGYPGFEKENHSIQGGFYLKHAQSPTTNLP